MVALAARRRAVLDGIADEELARREVADAAEKDREQDEAQADRRIAQARERVVELSAERLAAVGMAQATVG